MSNAGNCVSLTGHSSGSSGGAVHIGSLESGVDRLGLDRRHALVAHVIGDASDEVSVDAKLGQVAEEFDRAILGRGCCLLGGGILGRGRRLLGGGSLGVVKS